MGGESQARPEPETSVELPNGGKVAFVPYTWEEAYLDLTQEYGELAEVCVYLYTELESVEKQEVFLHMGFNDAGKVWVDGKPVGGRTGDGPAKPSQRVARITLRAGRTPILVKVDQAGGGWGAYINVYGTSAHKAVVSKHFPKRLLLAADRDLTLVGGTIRASLLPQPPWPEFDVPVRWRLQDGSTMRDLPETGPTISFEIPDGPSRELNLHATKTVQGNAVKGSLRIYASRQDDLAFPQGKEPMQIVVQLGTDLDRERIVYWRTDAETTDAFVELVAVPSLKKRSPDWTSQKIQRVKGKSTVEMGTYGPYRQHIASLGGLAAGGAYVARVGDGSSNGWSAPIPFQMNSAPKSVKHRKVYFGKDRFAGWPANQGICIWENEIVVGFTQGHLAKRTQERQHLIAPPSNLLQGRSVDGGQTWAVQAMPLPPKSGRRDFPGGVDFTHPDFALKAIGKDFYISQNRCHTWEGPYHLPKYNELPLTARTDYQVFGPKDLLLFLTTDKPNGLEGRSFSIRTTDGGLTWKQFSWLGPEPNEFSIMPSSVRLDSDSLLVTTRHAERTGHGRFTVIDLYSSDNRGVSWFLAGTPVVLGAGGNPPSMVRFPDGRLCITYGDRKPPLSIKAIFSEDDGRTWGQETVLRSGAGELDIGYPRSVVRPDGKCVTIYYFNDTRDGERYIDATIWSPPQSLRE